MLLLKPVTMETIAITVATPTTTPRMVRAARSLWARRARRANRKFSPNPRRNRPDRGAIPLLFVAEGFDGIQTRCLDGRVETEKDSDGHRHKQADQDRPGRRFRRQRLENELDDGRYRNSENDADRASEQRQRRRLGQELENDVAAEGADGLADSDLLRPLGHGDEHDVHHSDSADQERDHGDEDHRERDAPRDALEALDQLVG